MRKFSMKNLVANNLSKKKVSLVSRAIAFSLAGVVVVGNIPAIEASAATATAEDCTATVSTITTWTSGDLNFYQVQVELANNKQEAVEGWSFNMDLPADAELSQSWNGVSTIEGGKLNVTPCDYNATIWEHSNVVYGCIFSTTEMFDEEECYSEAVIGGTKVVVADGTYRSEDSDTQEFSTQANAEEGSGAGVAALPSKYAYDIKLVNSWGSGDETSYQLEMSLTNNSSKATNNWAVAIQLPAGTALSSGWCGNYSLENDTLTIKSIDWNRRILVGNTAYCGFIITGPAGLDVNALSSLITINKKTYFDNQDISGEVAAPMPDEKEKETTESKETKESSEETKESSEETKESSELKETTEETTPVAPVTGSPVAKHGQLSVSGTKIVDANGAPFQLRGVSTHGIAWFSEYINKDSFETLKNYGANVVRLALYSDPNAGFTTDLYSKVDAGVSYASELGMYVIIDWHILSDGNPQTYKAQAKDFFTYMSQKYADSKNVIYEICNEPNGSSWDTDIKPYAEEIIDVIRANDDNAIIIVGTPTWSQDVDVVAKNPIKGQDNIMYALHFYAATHTDSLRQKMTTALSSGLPVFVTEFGMCDASGNGTNDFVQTKAWIDLLDANGVGYVCWNLSNKAETSALINPSCNKTSGWTAADLSQSGQYYFNLLQSYKQ